LRDFHALHDVNLNLHAASRLLSADSVNSRAGPGKVFLVGTGPGDPGLLTLRAVQLMQTADVVLYDRLVSDDILQLVHGGARMVYVGKQAGYHTRTQVGGSVSCYCGMGAGDTSACVQPLSCCARSWGFVSMRGFIQHTYPSYGPCAGGFMVSKTVCFVMVATAQQLAHHHMLRVHVE
jgi:hypothetical protein